MMAKHGILSNVDLWWPDCFTDDSVTEDSNTTNHKGINQQKPCCF